MKKIVLFVFAALTLASFSNSYAGLVWSESFETDGQGSRYNASTPFRDSSNDYWMRTNDESPLTISTGSDYAGADGDFYWAAEDVDDNGGNGNSVQTLTVSGIDISGLVNISFGGLFAAGRTSGAYDAADFVDVEYRIDERGEWQTGLSFHALNTSSSGFNGGFGLDADGNGVGDSVLDSSFDSIGFNIGETGSFLDLRVSVSLSSADEEFAFDNLSISAVPEPSAFTYALIFGLTIFGPRRRK